MEPTIYKPSIYKGAGIYKTGDNGGCGDIGTLQPILTTVGNGVDFQKESFRILKGTFVTPTIIKQTDTIKFEVEFYFDSINNNNAIISPRVHWGNVDLHIENNGTMLWVGIPDSIGNNWQDWYNGDHCFDLSSIGKTAQSNTWYKLIVDVSRLNKTISVKLNDFLDISGTFDEIPKITDSVFNLFDNYDANFNYHSTGYIKYNGLKIYTDGTRVI